MQNNINDLLPIGSVVLLKEGTKKAMVFGVKQVDKASETEFDYIGVVYPEGNLGDGSQFFFNHDAIEEVFFRGYEDDERKVFVEKIKEYYDKL
ncbi:DUF4176 domain-containing protein [Butyrivibrio sp. YAB3001]|uniref:DUF4176 domain-containing protein n=1 Tax=Butyrivibrio sp. YAB3001 TaxID=1520812 RepID=UPI0008F68A64|nr:DUF4176 domain-containing protein [Butyrivibrio sp. YAB3001]SFB82516.1 hypothetical protein SAMN02910398_00762 [Butyrivibrio sp. YAB3001]